MYKQQQLGDVDNNNNIQKRRFETGFYNYWLLSSLHSQRSRRSHLTVLYDASK